MSFRQFLYRQLEPTAYAGPGLSPTNRAVALLILAGATLAILDTEQALRTKAELVFWTLEYTFVALFSIEYVARAYAAGENPVYAGLIGRIRYLKTPAAVIDLLAIAPFLLTAGGYNTFLLRLLKLIRLLRLARLGRFSTAWSALSSAVHGRRHELTISASLAGAVLVFSSALLYLVEGGHQPDAFGSIPRALWWSIATLTTVGYGDVTPVTTLGRIFAGFTALAGIGLIAMPTGILAAAFSQAMQDARNEGGK